jgi:hypothetical protein
MAPHKFPHGHITPIVNKISGTIYYPRNLELPSHTDRIGVMRSLSMAVL